MIKLQRETSVAQVTDLLRSAILHGELKPGTMLRQEELAARIGVSRAPLREAIKQLEGEGFVETSSYKGSYVASISSTEALDILAVRELLELDALGASVENHTPDSIAECRDSIRLARQDAKRDENWFEHNWNFHRLLHLPANRPYTLSMIHGCLRKAQLYTWVHGVTGSRLESCNEHERIVKAVEVHDLEKARQLLRKHLSGDFTRLRAEASA